MTREVRLGDLSDHEKESAILVLEGFSKKLRAALEECAQTSYKARQLLDQITETYGPRLGFLERHYVRQLDDRAAERRVAMNMQVWEDLR